MNDREVCPWYEVCPIKRFYEQGRVKREWVEQYCFQNRKDCKRRQLEEKGIPHPDEMLPDGSIMKT
ncbi:MAG: uracil-DNA glycosylase [Candidatus Nealsonbacteria bacterium]|nr:uracil-DNA glycosylase [Candidatus Nealsonbacteria bacterium]